MPLATQATNIQRTQQSVQSVLTGLLGEDAPLSVPIAVREISEEPMIPQVLRAATPLVPLSRTRPPSPRARASPQNFGGYSQPPSCAALKARTDELAGAKRLVAAGPADQARDAAHAVFPRAPAAAALPPVAALPPPQPCAPRRSPPRASLKASQRSLWPSEQALLSRVSSALGYENASAVRLDQAREVAVCHLSHGDSLPAGLSEQDVLAMLDLGARQWQAPPPVPPPPAPRPLPPACSALPRLLARRVSSSRLPNCASSCAGTLLLTVILVAFLIQNGESNWLQGLMLIVAYCIVSAGFFVHVDPELESTCD